MKKSAERRQALPKDEVAAKDESKKVIEKAQSDAVLANRRCRVTVASDILGAPIRYEMQGLDGTGQILAVVNVFRTFATLAAQSSRATMVREYTTRSEERT